ncbi:ArnT family glycosyltransferase [Marinomonas mediterranea]|uniref:ArnT family glycosyltransferase n=1 Tax=Marinomonas mediterranea TaxID=119864 RepID=UPI00234A5F12|nr:glycosyltransferase family 39 protein [Marinomonas mediterranea]WCN08833.1 phospholipid carrier-dependent glycosyltransferase [Marinomonas mediterranea]WCN12878.1 phospholipid carrier-dependent glycosyltransferase [Marinomonas mediterranea]
MKTLSLNKYHLISLIAVCLILRLISLGLYPLMDTTEARYALMANIMLETHNWITPMFDYGVPFWGKPPMFTWISSLGLSLFGNNEFGVRCFHWFAGVFTIVCVYLFCKKQFNQTILGWFAAAVLASTTPFLIFIGAVMTDSLLTLSMTGALLCFWQAINIDADKTSDRPHSQKSKNQGTYFKFGFFAFLGMGLLAKGPVILILVAISIGSWALFSGVFSQLPFISYLIMLWRSLPWIKGTLLMLAIALPWYLLAEYKTPGFLNYFLIGEHLKRFLVSGWHGDLYGTAHKHIRGTIWLYGIIALLPWSPFLIWKLFQPNKRFGAKDKRVKQQHGVLENRNDRKSNKTLYRSTHDFTSYLICWLISPMILFTFAGNILVTYIMPAIPASAILITHFYRVRPFSFKWIYLGWLSPLTLIIVVVALNTSLVNKVSDKHLISAWQQQPEWAASELIFVNKRSFSGEFYGGRAVSFTPSNQFDLLKTKKAFSNQFVNGVFIVDRGTKSDTAQQFGCQRRYSNTIKSLYFCPSSLNKKN